jgi:hypothetical protein
MVHRAPGRAAQRSRAANRAFTAAVLALGVLVLYALYFLVAYSTAMP